MNEISEIKEYAKKNSIPIVMDKGGEFICQTIRERGCKKILELNAGAAERLGINVGDVLAFK